MFSKQGSGPWANPMSTGNLAKAMSLVAIEDSNLADSQAMSQEPGMSQPLSQPAAGRISRSSYIPPRIDLSQANSLDLPPLCTPTDFATPHEQQFQLDYERPMNNDEDVHHSPAPSPVRFQKRPRAITGDLDSEVTSQASQSQSRSQGDPSTCSKAVSGLDKMGVGKPPMHPNRNNQRRRPDPPVIRNPFLCSAVDEGPCLYNASNSTTTTHKQYRLVQDYKQEEKLGHGNFSDVFRVVHRMSGKRYALKRSRRPVQGLIDKNMWLAEIQALAAVEGHPHIVTYYDSWVEAAEGVGETFFIKLELCGESLGSVANAAQQHVRHHSLDAGLQGSQGNSQQGRSGTPDPTASCSLFHQHSQSQRGADAQGTAAYSCEQWPNGPSNSHLSSYSCVGSGSGGCSEAVQAGCAGAGGHLDGARGRGVTGAGTGHGSRHGTVSGGSQGQRPPMREAELLDIMHQMVSALKHCHDLGLAHLDVKPDNIYRAQPQVPSAAGASGTATYKLGDFGLATAKNAKGPMLEGDVRYLAPELLAGKDNEAGLDKADMFALGATLYELATGSPLPSDCLLVVVLILCLVCAAQKLMAADPRDRPSADQRNDCAVELILQAAARRAAKARRCRGPHEVPQHAAA
ncbi:hypothetical protein QJQ45_028750 [Haematococcus lacustris]|nr:hypothetical protein QJQ45_028750 [Haematococcus lacustris]